MRCGNPCLLGGDEISGAKQIRRTVGIREMGVRACGRGGLNDFYPLISSVRLDGGFRESRVFFALTNWIRSGAVFPWSPNATVLLRKDSPGAVPFDNEGSASSVRIYGSDVGSHSHPSVVPGLAEGIDFMPATIGIYDTEVRMGFFLRGSLRSQPSFRFGGPPLLW